MKLSSILCASVVTLAAVASAPNGAFAAVNYNASKSNTGNIKTQPTTCPAGEAWNSATKKCEGIGAVNYNSSKSNSGNFTTQPKPTAPISTKYHCGKGEWMNNNGDCIKNPPNNPN
jgi:anaerobic selenocysteine-containing dehydrogenase